MRNTSLKRIISLVLLVMMICTQTITFLPPTVFAAGESEGVDRTNDSDEVGITFSNVKAYVGNEPTSITPSKNGEVSTYDFSKMNPDVISKVTFDLDFKILKKSYGDDIRKIKGGDYALIDLEKAGLKIGDIPQKDILFGTSTKIATYEVKNGVLKVVFSDEVNADKSNENISGKVSLGCGLDLDKFNSKNNTELTLLGKGDGAKTKLVFGTLTSDISGIKTQGEFVPSNTTILWTVSAGTNNVGSDINGSKVRVKFDAGKLSYKEAYIMVDGEKVYVDLEKVSGAEGEYTYQIKSDVTSTSGKKVTADTKAPFKLYVVTDVDSEELASDLSNGVDVNAEREITGFFEQGDMSITVDPENPANKSSSKVTLPRPHIAKSGEQINGNEMLWTLKVNDTDPKYVMFDSEIEDIFSGMDFVKGSFTIDGEKVSEGESTKGTLSVSKDSDKTTIKYKWPGDGKISSLHTITYITKIDTTKTYADKEVVNTVSLYGTWPKGSGKGPKINYGMPPVTEHFQYVFLTETASVIKNNDKANGLVEWNVKPSSRDEHWTTAKITVTNPGQKYVKGNGTYPVSVSYDGTVIKESELEEKGVLTWVNDVPVFNFNHSEYADLDKIKITYYTSVPEFFTTNGDDVTANGTSDIELTSGGDNTVDSEAKLTASASAKAVLKNEILSLSSKEYYAKDSLNPQIEYTLKVNSNGVNIDKNTVVTENLKELVATLIQGDKKTPVPADSFEIVEDSIKVSSTDVTESHDDGNIVLTYDNESSDTYTLKFRIKLKGEAAEKYLLHSEGGVGGSIAVKDSATIKGTATEGGVQNPVDVTVIDNADQTKSQIENALVSKNGVVTTEYIEWSMAINPNGTLLSDAKIIDVISKNLQLDYDSVELYTATHDGESTKLVAGEKATGWTKVINPSETGSMELTVNLPDGNGAYILKYKTRLTSAVSSVSNTARFENGNNVEESKSVAAIDDSASGFLNKVAHFKLKKMDSIDHSSLYGVLFGLYSEGKMVATAFSDKDGNVAFYAVPVDATNLTVKEMRGISDYDTVEENDSVLGINSFKAGMNDLSTSTGKIYNSRTKVGAFTFTKNYENADETKSANFVSKFTLSIKGESGKEVTVWAKKNASGEYEYSQGKTEGLPTNVGIVQTTIDEAGSVSEFEVKGSTSLTFKNLPWGEYVLHEVETKSGYSLSNDVQFMVDKDGTVVTKAGLLDGNVLLNKQIKLVISKKAEEGLSLSGCELAIYSDYQSALKGSDENIVVDPRDSQTKLLFEANGGSGDFSDTNDADDVAEFSIPELPGFTVDADGKRTESATYYLAEKKAPLDKRLSSISPLKLVVDTKGNVKYGSAGTLVGDNRTIAVTDRTVKSKFEKLDQFGNAVTGAKIVLQRKNADAWEDVEDSTFVTNGTANSFKLEREGEYRLVETEIPDGYVSAAHLDGTDGYAFITFSTDKFGKIIVINDGNNAAIKASTDPYLSKLKNAYNATTNTFTLRNEKVVGKAQFTKYSSEKDNDGNYIPFKAAKATFKLYSCDENGDSEAEVLFGGKPVTIKSDANGLVSTDSVSTETEKFYLEKGFYFFREISTESDFVLPENADTDVFEIKESNRFTYDNDGAFTKPVSVKKNGKEVVNEPISAFVLVEKTDKEGNPIPGVKFSLTKAGETAKVASTVAEKTNLSSSDSNGNLHTIAVEKGCVAFGGLKVGTYTLREEVPVAGYKKDTTEHTIVISQNGDVTCDGEAVPKTGDNRIAKVVVINEKNSFSVTKKSEDGSTVSLKGTKFSVFDKDGNKVAEKEVSGDADADKVLKFSGIITPVSDPLTDTDYTYVVKESAPAKGYKTSANYYVRMNYEGELFASRDKTNFEKVEGNNLEVMNKLNGISFVMKDKETKEVIGGNSTDWELAITPKSGSTFSDGSKAGKFIKVTDGEFKGILVSGNDYEVREITNPLGYKSFKEVALITVDDEGVVTLKSTDDVFSVKDNVITALNEKAALRVIKTGVKGHSVDGTTFTLTPISGTFVDGSTDSVEFKMKESDGGESGISDIYEGFKGQLVAGVVYKLTETRAADTYVVADDKFIKMDEEGIVSVSLKEDEGFAKAIYTVDGKGENIVEIKNSSNSLEFTTYVNAYEYGKEEEHVILPNATFTLYSKYEDGELSNPVKCKSTNDKGEIVSDKDGKIVIEGLKPGKYYIKETDVPVYHSSMNKVIAEETDNLIATFTVSDNGKVSQMTSVDGEQVFGSYLNDTVRASFHMTKVDALNVNKVISDSEYVLYRKEQDQNVCDSYKNCETSLNYNRLHASGVRVAPTFSHLAVSGLTGIDITDSVSLLSGNDSVDFNLDDYTEIMRVRTRADGSISLDGLLTGYDYVLKEAVAPTGSQVSREPIQFNFDIDRAGAIKTSLVSGKGTVEKTSGSKNLNVVWKEPPTVVSVEKKTEGGMFLKGATLRIEDEKGNVVVKDFVSGQSAYEISGVLKAGQKYRLVEVKAPAGYDIASPVTFTVKEQEVGSTYADIQKSKTVVTMIDKASKPANDTSKGVRKWVQKLMKAPKTGTKGGFLFLLILTIIASGSALAIMVFSGKRFK